MYNFEKIQFTNEVDFMKMEMWLNFFGKVVIAAAIIVAAILIVKAINAGVEEVSTALYWISNGVNDF